MEPIKADIGGVQFSLDVNTMVLDTKLSCIVSTVVFLVSIASLHLIKPFIVDMPLMYISIGIYGGLLCVILLTVGVNCAFYH